LAVTVTVTVMVITAAVAVAVAAWRRVAEGGERFGDAETRTWTGQNQGAVTAWRRHGGWWEERGVDAGTWIRTCQNQWV
jgi:hypothetical protein